MAGWKITTRIGHQIQQMHRGADTDMATNRKLARGISARLAEAIAPLMEDVQLLYQVLENYDSYYVNYQNEM